MPFKEPFKPKWKSPLGGFATQVDVGASSLAKPHKSPVPDHNPFRAGLGSNPIPSKVDIEAGNILNDALSNGKKLGGLGISIAQDEVQDKIVVAAIGKTAATAVGVVAIPFVAANVFESVAPAVQRWLKGGWKGGGGVAPPGVLGIVPYPPGSTVGARYRVNGKILLDNGPAAPSFQIDAIGPIKNITAPVVGGGNYQYVSCTGNVPAQVYLSSQMYNVYGVSKFTLIDVSITKLDAPSDPGTTTGETKPSYVTNPKPDKSFAIPPFPLPPLAGNLPTTEHLSDLFKDSVPSQSPVPVFGGERGPLEWNEPSPESSTKPGSLTKPLPYTYPSPPKNPVPPFTEDDECSPCMLKIGKKLEEVGEELKKKKDKDEKTEEPTCETYPFEYSHGVCSSDGFKIYPRTLILAEKPTAALRNEFDNMLALAAQGCGLEPIAAIPDWWQVRVGADRGQIVVAFRKADSRTYHQIAIPHPKSVSKWTENLMGDYAKGPWSGVLTLKDNSKFIINCASKNEAQRMVEIAKSLIKPEMLFSPSAEQFTERKGNAVGVAQMRGRQAYYFSKGQKDAKPDWRAQFD